MVDRQPRQSSIKLACTLRIKKIKNKKKRDRTTFELDSPEVIKDSPPKTICLLTSSSDSEEEEAEKPEITPSTTENTTKE